MNSQLRQPLRIEPKILIVEDISAVRKVLVKRLTEISSDITTAKDGYEGLTLANENNFDLIISDVHMPNMSGLEMCHRLKNNDKTRRVPVIILSSREKERDIERGFSAGASAYVKKNAIDKQLITTIRDVLADVELKKASTVMVVEDSPTIRRHVVNGLSKAGFVMISAANGQEALELLLEHKPDLIISDLEMPEMDGMELCRHVRSDPALCSIPFVVMSTHSKRSKIRTLIKQGASAYLVKPFHIEQLVITAEKLLSEQFKLLLLERQRLENENQSMLASITSLVTALEAKDPYTRGHSERVSVIATGIGRLLKLPEKELNILTLGSRLHDLGKIGTPDGVLLKPGQLSDDEFTVIRQHPEIGAKILEPIPSMKAILPIVRHHHERIDGKGYPDGLKGNEIPLLARITLVADCYDALTSDRPYRSGMPDEQALAIIKEVRGTQLCGECVELFLQWHSEQIEPAGNCHPQLTLDRLAQDLELPHVLTK